MPDLTLDKKQAHYRAGWYTDCVSSRLLSCPSSLGVRVPRVALDSRLLLVSPLLVPEEAIFPLRTPIPLAAPLR